MIESFLKIADTKYGFEEDIKNLDLVNLYNLRNDSVFGTVSYDGPAKISSGLLKDCSPFLSSIYPDPLPSKVIKAYVHRTLCASKAISLWNKYKKVYNIDKDFYKDFVDTEEVDVDFSLLEQLPFDSFYIDLENAPLISTNHYTNVVGVIVNQIDKNNIHFTVVDNKNSNYNPVFAYAGHPLFPKEFDDHNTKEVRFVDFVISKSSSSGKLTSKSGSTVEVFGWEMQYGGVIEGNDMFSPVINSIMRFTIQFLYFLNSKSADIEERKPGSSSYQNSNTQEVKVWDVGYRYGEKIRKLNKKIALYGEKITGGTKSRPRAYVRCAHWHHYWCGSNENKHLELRWLEPTYCNGSVSDIITLVNKVSDNVSMSTGEEIVSAYLDKMGVSYKKEHTVNIKNHNRRFDFKIDYSGQVYFIEFDGEQHFKSVEKFGGEEGLKERRRADYDKNKYAKKERIPLLRIRFDQISSVPEIIDDFLEKPSVHRLNPLIDNSSYYQV